MLQVVPSATNFATKILCLLSTLNTNFFKKHWTSKPSILLHYVVLPMTLTQDSFIAMITFKFHQFLFSRKSPQTFGWEKSLTNSYCIPLNMNHLTRNSWEIIFIKFFYRERERELREDEWMCQLNEITRVSSIYTICVWTQIYAENSAKMCYDSNQSYKNEF